MKNIKVGIIKFISIKCSNFYLQTPSILNLSQKYNNYFDYCTFFCTIFYITLKNLMNIKISKWNKLSQDDANFIYWERKKVFWNIDKIDLKFNKKYWDEIFFIMKDDNWNIISFGCLVPVIISYLNIDYNILWISGIVSIIKRKWYWKLLMKSIREYLFTKDKVWVGFCTKENSSFYNKCEFNIYENWVKKFVLKNDFWEFIYHPDSDDENVIFIDRKEKIFSSTFQNSDEKVLVPFFW